VSMAASRLRLEIDRVPLWRAAPDGSQDHVEIKQLVEDFTRYLYLPRLQSSAVLTDAVVDGVKLLTWAQDAFAYAESYDDAAGRYRGRKGGQIVHVAAEASVGLIVKPARAWKQLDEEIRDQGTTGGIGTGMGTTGGEMGGGEIGGGTGRDTGGTGDGGETRSQPRRFHGTIRLDAGRTGRDASKVADEVLAHLAGLVGADVAVTLEITARIPDGVPESVVTHHDVVGRFLALGLERIERVLQGLDLFLQRHLAPHKGLDMLGLDGLVHSHGGERRQALGKLAGERAHLPVEVAIVRVDDPYGVGNDFGMRQSTKRSRPKFSRAYLKKFSCDHLANIARAKGAAAER